VTRLVALLCEAGGLASNSMRRKASSELCLLHSIFPRGNIRTSSALRVAPVRVTHGVKMFVNFNGGVRISERGM
jgi:hypothetical protein